jgi:uncharacterized protein YbaR (Trm112 family)
MENNEVVCRNYSSVYLIKNDIPVMHMEEAKKYENKQRN